MENMPKYLILLHKNSKIVYVNNLTDVIQIIMFKKSFASVYQKKSPTDDAYHYLIDMTYDYTQDQDEE